jgi:hypothetical protein
MKRLTLACILLSFCATSAVAGPAPPSNRQTSGESKCSHGFKECRESLNDFKEAEQFMQLRATVLADLNRLERSRPTKPRIISVRDAGVNRRKPGTAPFTAPPWDRMEYRLCKLQVQSGRYRWSLLRGLQRRNNDHVST